MVVQILHGHLHKSEVNIKSILYRDKVNISILVKCQDKTPGYSKINVQRTNKFEGEKFVY